MKENMNNEQFQKLKQRTADAKREGLVMGMAVETMEELIALIDASLCTDCKGAGIVWQGGGPGACDWCGGMGRSGACAACELAERSTPAATTSGAAGTIEDGVFYDLLMHAAPGRIVDVQRLVTHIDQHTAAAVAAAREEEREKLEAAHSRALTRTEMESRRPAENECDALAQAIGNAAIKAGIAQAVDMTGPTLCMLADDMATELARLRAAPVVGEAVNLADDEESAAHQLERIGQRIGYGRSCQILGELWDRMLEREYGRSTSRGKMERRKDIEAIEAVIRSRTVPHAAKEAGKVDEEKPNCRNQGGVCACRSGGSFGGCAMERAALARTTNKEAK